PTEEGWNEAQSPEACIRGGSTDSASPRRMGPSANVGTSNSGSTVRFVALRGNSLRRSNFSPASRKTSAEKPISSARSTPQNHNFSSLRCRKSKDSSSLVIARLNEEARKNTSSVHAWRGNGTRI